MFDSRSKHRPPSPPKVLWFEFLLNPTILEKHLCDANIDPEPIDLIVKFLTNAVSQVASDQVSANHNSGSNAGGNGIEEIPVESESTKGLKEEKENKKSIALKLLALKVAAFLQWDLKTLAKKLPLTMQQALLLELLKITGNDVNGSANTQINIKDLSADAQFAQILYNIWVLQAVVESSYPVKNHKVPNIQLPGQVDPTVLAPAVVESILRKLNEDSVKATMVLESLLEQALNVRMPLMNCFTSLTEECPNPVHKWDVGLTLKSDDVICQICFELGRFYFFQEKYDKASKHFIRASDLFPKLKDPVFCQLDPTKLKGFHSACAHLLGYQTSDSSTPLKETLQTSVKAGHTKTIEILKSDNLKLELPVSLRDAVELSVLQEHEDKMELLLYVVFLNAVRRTLSGKVIINNWFSLLKAHEEKSSLVLCELLKDVIPTATEEMKTYLKNFVRILCSCSIPAKQLMRKYEKHLSMIFQQSELETLFFYGPKAKRESLKFDKNFTDILPIQVATLERRLLSSSEAMTTKHLINQLRTQYNYQGLWSINKRWELPLAVSIFFKNVPPTVDQEMIHILLAKSAEFRAIKKYGEARILHQMIHNEIRNSSPRLSRFLNCELLRLDLLEVLDSPVHICQPAPHRAEIVQRILSLFTSFKKEREVPPDPNLMELCSAVLLNFREWDKLLEIDIKGDPYIEFSRVVATVCKEILNKSARNATRELWEIVLPIFANPGSNQHKRSGSGLVKDVSREIPQAIMGRSALIKFIRKLKDTLVLGIIISCLARFYNILKDDSVGDLFLEHQGLWPTILSNSNMFNMTAVAEIFQNTLHHALSIHPTHTSWLRTKGDIMYIQSHYASALKYYISAAMVSSDFFGFPLPKPIFDDLQYKHMIHCCTKLQNHTQAAVLYQFLDDPNYSLAFKSLGERVCNDSCDTYYLCIWDITLLEFLVNHHTKRGELDCRQFVIQLIGQLELNSNNNEEIQREAASIRKGWFLRAMAKQYL